jgi:hypothetical protein
MKTHHLKCYPDIFEVMFKEEKSFDIRKNDRNFEVGDQIILYEYDPIEKQYLSRHKHGLITFIMKDPNPFIDLGDKVILSLKFNF